MEGAQKDYGVGNGIAGYGCAGWETTAVRYLEHDRKVLWGNREGCLGFSDYWGDD